MKKEVLVIDNFDSFTYNLVHYLEDLNCRVTVWRNDEFELEEINPFSNIIISPGPGLPEDAGIVKEVIKHYGSSKKILGVCLGHQAIAEVFGYKLLNLPETLHGVASTITITEKSDCLFKNLPSQIEVGHYHSWVVENNSDLNTLIITSIDDMGRIMSLKHPEFNLRGVQFHPESVLTPMGKQLLMNWLNC